MSKRLVNDDKCRIVGKTFDRRWVSEIMTYEAAQEVVRQMEKQYPYTNFFCLPA